MITTGSRVASMGRTGTVVAGPWLDIRWAGHGQKPIRHRLVLVEWDDEPESRTTEELSTLRPL